MVKNLIISTYVLMLLVAALSLQGNAVAQEKGKTPVKELQEKDIKANKDAIYSDINTLIADIFMYKIRPKTRGGGEGSYRGYKIDAKGQWGKNNPNAVYKIKKCTDKSVTIEAKSLVVKGGIITMTADENGRVHPEGLVKKVFK